MARKTKREIEIEQQIADIARSRISSPDRPCDSCGDPAVSSHCGARLCKECYDEKALGKIAIQNVNFFGGGRGGFDGESPWQQNAIRDMEG